MTWLLFSMITVGAFGVYGVLLHTGIMSMADPVNGRYKAFLFVGIAYLLTAVLGSLIALKMNGVEWSFPARGMMWSTLAGIAGASFLLSSLGRRSSKEAASLAQDFADEDSIFHPAKDPRLAPRRDKSAPTDQPAFKGISGPLRRLAKGT